MMIYKINPLGTSIINSPLDNLVWGGGVNKFAAQLWICLLPITVGSNFFPLCAKLKSRANCTAVERGQEKGRCKIVQPLGFAPGGRDVQHPVKFREILSTCNLYDLYRLNVLFISDWHKLCTSVFILICLYQSIW